MRISCGKYCRKTKNVGGYFFLFHFVKTSISLLKLSGTEFSGSWSRLLSNPAGLATKCVERQGPSVVLCNRQLSCFTELVLFPTQKSPWPELEAGSSLGARLL